MSGRERRLQAKPRDHVHERRQRIGLHLSHHLQRPAHCAVVNVIVQAESDFAVTCKDGNKYHVYRNDIGRVVVDKQK